MQLEIPETIRAIVYSASETPEVIQLQRMSRHTR